MDTAAMILAMVQAENRAKGNMATAGDEGEGIVVCWGVLVTYDCCLLIRFSVHGRSLKGISRSSRGVRNVWCLSCQL